MTTEHPVWLDPGRSPYVLTSPRRPIMKEQES